MANDSDLFNRWQAANTYADAHARRGGHARLGARQVEPRKACATRGRSARRCRATALEPAYRAELLQVADTGRRRPHHRHECRSRADSSRPPRGSMKLIGKTLWARSSKTSTPRWTTSGPFSPDAQSAGRRALRNAALTLLTARGTPARHRAASRSTIATATNMTDRAHALFLLATAAAPKAKRALGRLLRALEGRSTSSSTPGLPPRPSRRSPARSARSRR